MPGAWASDVAAVCFLELLFLFHFDGELHTQHNRTGSCALALQRVEAERKARVAVRNRRYQANRQRVEARRKRNREADPEGEAARRKRFRQAKPEDPERVAARRNRNKAERGWEAEIDVVQRGSGGAAARAEGQSGGSPSSWTQAAAQQQRVRRLTGSAKYLP